MPRGRRVPHPTQPVCTVRHLPASLWYGAPVRRAAVRNPDSGLAPQRTERDETCQTRPHSGDQAAHISCLKMSASACAVTTSTYMPATSTPSTASSGSAAAKSSSLGWTRRDGGGPPPSLKPRTTTSASSGRMHPSSKTWHNLCQRQPHTPWLALLARQGAVQLQRHGQRDGVGTSTPPRLTGGHVDGGRT